MDVINRIRISTNFHLSEFECPHCHVVKISPALLDALEQLRTMLHNHPIVIKSGYRCKQYNNILYKRINDDRISRGLDPLPVPKRSVHTQGLAVDLANHLFAEEDIEELHRLGFNGIGLGAHKTHLDVRPGPLVKWSYDDA